MVATFRRYPHIASDAVCVPLILSASLAPFNQEQDNGKTKQQTINTQTGERFSGWPQARTGQETLTDEKIVQFEGKKPDPATIRALVADTLIEGATLGQWWGKQARDLRESFMREIRIAMQNGENLTQATVRIVGGTVDGVTVPGVMKTTKRKAGALVSTAMNAVSNDAALRTFQENSDVIKAVTQVSTLDCRNHFHQKISTLSPY